MEAAKPDYIDLDKDGNKTEPMKKAAKDKEAKEKAKDKKQSFPDNILPLNTIPWHT